MGGGSCRVSLWPKVNGRLGESDLRVALFGNSNNDKGDFCSAYVSPKVRA